MAAELAPGLTASEAERLEQAEAVVRAYCGWHVAPVRTVELTLDGSGGDVLLLPTLHLIEVISLSEDGTELDVEDYEWSSYGWLRKVNRGHTWTRKLGGVVVSFTHGHARVPAQVTGVVQAVAQRALDNPGSRPRDQVGPFGDTFSQTAFNQAPALGLLDSERQALAPYKLPPRL